MTLLGSVLQVFDRSGRKEPQVLDGKQSLEVLRTAEDLLDEALKLLNGIGDDLSARQVKIYRSKYNQLYLMVVDAKSDVRERGEKTTVFAGREEREKFHSAAQLLLRYCRAYHTDVVSASRKVYAQSSTELGIEPIQLSTDAPSSSISSTMPPGSLVSLPQLFNKDAETVCLSLFHNPPSGRPIFAVVSDTSASTEESSTQVSGSKPYTRLVTCANDTRTALLLQHCQPDEDDAERSSGEILEFADEVMQRDLDNLKDCEVVDQSDVISLISSIFSSFNLQRLGAPDVASEMIDLKTTELASNK